MATIRDQLQKYQGKMVSLTICGEKNTEDSLKKIPGRIKSLEDDHVVILDGIGQEQYIAYNYIAHFQEAWDDPNWPK